MSHGGHRTDIWQNGVRSKHEAPGLSQEVFAVREGIHRMYLSSVELGKVQISIRIADQLATALGTPLIQLWEQVEHARQQPAVDS